MEPQRSREQLEADVVRMETELMGVSSKMYFKDMLIEELKAQLRIAQQVEYKLEMLQHTHEKTCEYARDLQTQISFMRESVDSVPHARFFLERVTYVPGKKGALREQHGTYFSYSDAAHAWREKNGKEYGWRIMGRSVDVTRGKEP